MSSLAARISGEYGPQARLLCQPYAILTAPQERLPRCRHMF